MSNLACPFCGAFKAEVVMAFRAFTLCRSCGAQGPLADFDFEVDTPTMKTEALRLWNGRADGSLLPLPGNGKKPVKKKECSRWCYEMALWLRELMPENLRLSATWLDKWAEVFDALTSIDKRDDEEIARVCSWARADAFWSKNFMSPVKLRERNPQGVQYYDVFLAAMAKPAAVPSELKLR